MMRISPAAMTRNVMTFLRIDQSNLSIMDAQAEYEANYMKNSHFVDEENGKSLF